MAWYNNIGDLTGDLGSIVSGKNPTNGTPPSNIPAGGPGVPGGSGIPLGMPSSSVPASATSADPRIQTVESAIMSNSDLSGILQGIKNVGGDVLGAISNALPHIKNADGSDGGINWGAIGGDIAGWVDKNKSFIADTVAAFNQSALQKKALADATTDYATRQPLRDAGMAGMLNPSAKAPNLTQLGKAATAGQALQAPTPIPLGGNISSVQAAAGNNPFAPAKPIPLAGGPSGGMPQPPAAPIPMAPQPYVPQKPGATTAPTPTPGGPPTGPLAPPALPIALQGPPTPPPKYTMPAVPKVPTYQVPKPVVPGEVQPIPLAGQ